MGVEREQVAFATNLRMLCGMAPSVAEVCRGIGISRQQFNKYLAGQHLPSRSNLNLIASYFLVEPKFLLLPPEQFSRKLGTRPLALFRALGELPGFWTFTETAAASQADAEALCGIYERYQYSAIRDGRVLRSILVVEKRESVVCHAYVERFPDPDHPLEFETVFKYRGFTVVIAGRVFMVDFETNQCNEMTVSMLTPRVRTNRPLLLGLTMGVAASLAREPFATRVALRRVSKGALTLAHLRQAGVLMPDDGSIPRDIASYLDAGRPILRAND